MPAQVGLFEVATSMMTKYKSYSEARCDPRWQRKRLEVMQRADFKCEKCEASDKMLAIHHTEYIWGKMPWEYPDEMLLCLCEPCHDAETARQEAADYKECEYLTAVWERAKASKPLAADGYVLQMRDLVALCFELQTLAKDGTFYLACRHVGALLGIDFRKASKMLHKLERDKIIERVSTGKVKMRPGQKVKANEYRYLGG